MMNLFLWLLCMHACMAACSGNRSITLSGSHMEFVDGVVHRQKQREDVRPPTNSSFQVSPRRSPVGECIHFCSAAKDSSCPTFPFLQTLTYETPGGFGTFRSEVLLKVANETLPCSTITYHPDPEFSSFTTLKSKDGVRVTIQVTGPISPNRLFDTHQQYPFCLLCLEKGQQAGDLLSRADRVGHPRRKRTSLCDGNH